MNIVLDHLNLTTNWSVHFSAWFVLLCAIYKIGGTVAGVLGEILGRVESYIFSGALATLKMTTFVT